MYTHYRPEYNRIGIMPTPTHIRTYNSPLFKSRGPPSPTIVQQPPSDSIENPSSTDVCWPPFTTQVSTDSNPYRFVNVPRPYATSQAETTPTDPVYNPLHGQPPKRAPRNTAMVKRMRKLQNVRSLATSYPGDDPVAGSSARRYSPSIFDGSGETIGIMISSLRLTPRKEALDTLCSRFVL